MKRYLLPLALFLALAVFLGIGLNHDPRELPSPLVGKAAPAFALPRLVAEGAAEAAHFTPAEMKGKVWMLNVWASWCVSCRQEHPVLMDVARSGIVPLIGLDYKDKPEDGKAWLAQHGDPYRTSIVDADGRVGIDWGVYGVPETFVIDKDGVIRHKHIGPVTADALRQTILPLVRKLQQS